MLLKCEFDLFLNAYADSCTRSGRLGHARQANRKFRTLARRAGHADGAAGDFQHAAHQRKAEAVAIPAVGGIALIKLVKDVRERRFVHAASRVGDRDNHVVAILHLPQNDAPTRLGELDRVGNQVVEHNFHHRLIREHHHTLLKLRVKINVLRLPAGFVRKGAIAELAGQIIRRGVGRDFLVFKLVEPQNVGNHRAQAFAGGGNRRGILPLFRFAQSAARQRRGVAVDNGQRLAKWSITAISFIYVFTVMTVLGLAIEIGQKITGTGDMDFRDVVAGLYGVLAFFAVYTVYRLIVLLVRQLMRGRKKADA